METLRSAVVDKLTRKIPVRPLWWAALSSPRIFAALLSVAQRFDNRPGRLYSFVCRKN
jgi:hypothetical protein